MRKDLNKKRSNDVFSGMMFGLQVIMSKKLMTCNTGDESKVDNYAGLTFHSEYLNDDDVNDDEAE